MKQMKKKINAIRKRSFLLIEVLIALTLVALCLFPLLKEKVRRTACVQNQVSKHHLYLVAKHAFADLIVWLDETQPFTLEQMIEGVEGITPSYTLYPLEHKKQFYYTIRKKRMKNEDEQVKGLMLQIAVKNKKGSPSIYKGYLVLQKEEI